MRAAAITGKKTAGIGCGKKPKKMKKKQEISLQMFLYTVTSPAY